MLSPDNFAAFFEEVHGCDPFPWQKRLLAQVAEQGEWPCVLDLPTGSGKTAAIDIAVFHLALQADRGEHRRAPVRIAFVVDRRLVVDDAFTRAQKLEKALAAPHGPVTGRVADCLKNLSGDGPPLIARRLRGGIPREDDWARTPSQPTVLCSTVDQVGSRLLFRGYGVSDSMKPVHAGLMGSDCLILLDEAHLAEPFRQTLDWARIYRGKNWREANTAAPWGAALLTATPGEKPQDVFSLDDEDRSHPVLTKRLGASKPARLIVSATSKTKTESATGIEDKDEKAGGSEKDLVDRITTIMGKVQDALDHFNKAENGAPSPAIGVVVNRVARARSVFRQLTEKFGPEKAECLLLIGPARPVDRDKVASQLAPIRTGAERALEKPLILVATQCIEVGVDIDLDALITEAAPLDCLRQRFGRLNRAGRNIVTYAAIIAAKSDLSARADDPVYGSAIKTTWKCITKAARKEKSGQIVEFGLSGFKVAMEIGALSPKEDAPVLLPAHLDLLSQTSPIPAADPDIGLYLHGTSRQPDSIAVIWRADIDPKNSRDEDIRRLLMLVLPRSLEAIELPIWAVRRWLVQEDRTLTHLADIATAAAEEEERARPGGAKRKVFRWKGNDERSRWIKPEELRPGDTAVVPASYGGVDEFGWNPGCEEPATDVGRRTAEPFAGCRFAVRVAPGLLGDSVSAEALANALAEAESGMWRDVRASVAALDIPEKIREDLLALDKAKRKGGVIAYLDVYGTDDDRPRGVVFVAPFGINGYRQDEDGRPNTTEDDTNGSIPGFPLLLQQHSDDVKRKAECFAKAAGLPAERVVDLKLAGFLHDAGKDDPRFQAWLYYGDPLGPDPDDANTTLAKSSRPLPPAARTASGLPKNWRHEARSVRLARTHDRLATAHDPDLVLWLVGSHHGYGRPFFPHQDPTETAPDVGPQSLAFDHRGFDWPSLFAELKARYGVWELARMEAILRLADHRASEERAREIGE
jgi:CRISPR-associated endonuclease/helicase Cas3